MQRFSLSDAKRNSYYVVVSFLTYIHLQQASTNSAVSYIPYKAWENEPDTSYSALKETKWLVTQYLKN